MICWKLVEDGFLRYSLLVLGGDGRPPAFQQLLAPSTIPAENEAITYKVSDLAPVYR